MTAIAVIAFAAKSSIGPPRCLSNLPTAYVPRLTGRTIPRIQEPTLGKCPGELVPVDDNLQHRFTLALALAAPAGALEGSRGRWFQHSAGRPSADGLLGRTARPTYDVCY